MLFAALALQGTVARSAQQASECCLDPHWRGDPV